MLGVQLLQQVHDLTDEFKERYRWRAGVEATMSEYDRRTGVKRLRFRGFKAVRFAAILKAIGMTQQITQIPIASIIPDEDIYPRKGIDHRRVGIFAENIRDGFKFDPPYFDK